NGGRVLAQFMRDSLSAHVRTNKQGPANVRSFLVGDAKIEELRGERLLQVFNGAAQLARQQNNTGFFGVVRRPASVSGGGNNTNDSRPKTIADMNAQARKYWAERAAKQG